MEKTRILAIAPYHDFLDITQQLAAEFPDIILDSYAGNLDTGLELIQSRSTEDYDVVISRGGTAKKLRESTNLMVVETEVSAVDMLRSIKMAEATRKPFAIVGYENIIAPARTIVQILNMPNVIIREVTQETILPCLRELALQNIRLVIGDVISAEAATTLNMQSILVTSSAESIRKALCTATELSRTAKRRNRKQRLCMEAVDLSPDGILILDEQLRLLRSNSAALSLDLNAVKSVLQEANLQESKKDDFRFIRKSNDTQYDITVRRTVRDEQLLYYCYIVSSPRLPKSVGSVRVENLSPLPEQSYFLFSDSVYIQPVRELLERAVHSSDSVLIWGAVGTEKASVARYIYRNGLHSAKPLICINCQTLTVKQWHSYIDAPACPLNTSGFTVLLEDLQAMPPEVQGCVANYIEDTQLHKRHQLLSTCTQNPILLVQTQKLRPSLFRALSQVQIHMPSLDSRREDLAALAGVYIAQLNRTLGMQVIGPEPEALELIKNFHWSLNLDLFHSVLYQLVIKTQGYYISAEDTRKVLEQAQTEEGGSTPDKDWLDLTKPLDEIERDIILHVLQEENMNQSRTAKRLNIGRSTLWRKLN